MKHSILCVDDEVDNVDALERLFRRKYNVLRATSGAEALDILKQHQISLIVTDQRMPNMTGVEFLSESMKHRPDAIRILLTGYTDVESVISAINSGQIYRYVTKPWDPVDLVNTVDKAIERFELSAELKEKNQALELALKELKVLDEAKSNFMILINHELKTPLTTMLSFLALLQESQLNLEQTKFVQRITQSAHRLQALINDSLELVSAESGAMPVKMTTVNLQKLVSELSHHYREQMNLKSMSFVTNFEADQVRGDLKAVHSIFTRLFDNAVKFGSEKSTIHLTTVAMDNEKVQINLTNEGKTVNTDMIAKILKPFALDENIMHHSKGTGLGLSVVQALLHRLGSNLVINVQTGRFAASFILPADK